MKFKVCGMKFQENIEAVASLQPDYMGFIFYEKSPRNFEGDIPALPITIKKTGVFVDASVDFIIKKVKQYNFRAIQLHGNESSKFCQELKDALTTIKRFNQIEIWKVFSIKDEFDFDRLSPYEEIVDYFLFDTKGKEKGGNGYTFDWSVLKNYPSTTPFVLSGGIGSDQIDSILSFMKTPVFKYLYAVDLNSKFESKPGLKNTKELKEFLSDLSGH
ncbi:phosphoribosylanthranilate isomerase [Aquimarina sediminis]|uniref:phosphoribosylanthranilate isomerase n=1 Tax=Aquimarina sediminis TaxID=2070536 RepID=UPI001F4ED33C|nr:phosphoribosylanthranilate isomerase [Aquimarina sediminis]